MNNKNEQKYYGINACLAIWKYRKSDIIKIYLSNDAVGQFRKILSWCAEKKIAYKLVTINELEKITESKHHEEVCFLARPKSFLTTEQFFKKFNSKENISAVCLDGVTNPHNFGAILRSCAHFGISYLIGKNLPSLSAATCRVAEGGAECIDICKVENLIYFFENIKKSGAKILAISNKSGSSLFKHKFSAKNLFVFGSEGSGIAPNIIHLSDVSLSIPGSGLIESLNVSAAVSVTLGTFWERTNP